MDKEVAVAVFPPAPEDAGLSSAKRSAYPANVSVAHKQSIVRITNLRQSVLMNLMVAVPSFFRRRSSVIGISDETRLIYGRKEHFWRIFTYHVICNDILEETLPDTE
jgi:hypothetical protein